MIKASEARKTSKEAQEAKKKHQTLKEARELEQKFKVRMSDTDLAVKNAMKKGDEEIELRWDKDELPQALRERYTEVLCQAGYKCAFHSNGDGDGWEIAISWKEAQ